MPASLHGYAKEQRKLCQSILSCTLLSNLILITALYISLCVHNLQWLPISTELNRNFLVFHWRHILASAFLSGLIACNCVSYRTNHLLFPGSLSHFLRPWLICIVCSASNTQAFLSDFCRLTPFKTNFFHVPFWISLAPYDLFFHPAISIFFGGNYYIFPFVKAVCVLFLSYLVDYLFENSLFFIMITLDVPTRYLHN